MFTGSSSHIFAPCSLAPPEGGTKKLKWNLRSSLQSVLQLRLHICSSRAHHSPPSTQVQSVYTTSRWRRFWQPTHKCELQVDHLWNISHQLTWVENKCTYSFYSSKLHRNRTTPQIWQWDPNMRHIGPSQNKLRSKSLPCYHLMAFSTIKCYLRLYQSSTKSESLTA